MLLYILSSYIMLPT